MTVPTYRAGTGPQPDPLPATARAAVDDLFRLHALDLSTAYLINPATRTKMAVRLPGLPSGHYASLAW